MSTIDINSVAGFKAVDANGNELGIMSLADITAAVKESLMQDAAMARSVATLSEASTLAATDTYEDKLDIKTDLTWARGLDASGNPILISKESLASVVGGLIGIANDTKSGLVPSGFLYNITKTISPSEEISFLDGTNKISAFICISNATRGYSNRCYYLSNNTLTEIYIVNLGINVEIKDNSLKITNNQSDNQSIAVRILCISNL